MGQNVYGAGQGVYPQQNIKPGQYPSDEPFVTDYTASYPQNAQGGYGYASGQLPNDPNILRSKVLELKEENGRLRNLASQGQIPRE